MSNTVFSSKSFEKILFLGLTCYQLGKTDTSQPYFVETWGLLTKEEQDEYVVLQDEIHQIWSYINMPPHIQFSNSVNSVTEYHKLIKNIDSRILLLCLDFNITLKDEISPESKKELRRLFGEDYSSWFKE